MNGSTRRYEIAIEKERSSFYWNLKRRDLLYLWDANR